MMDLVLCFIFSVLVVLYASWVLLLLYPKREKSRDYFPGLSIIIPAHNEEGIIGTTVESVLKAHYPGEKEIIVINDGSTDKTKEIVERMAKQNSNVRIYNIKHGGKANALNFGIRNSKHEIIVTLDADSKLEKDSLIKIVKPFSDERVGGVSGIIRALHSKNPLTWFQDFEYILSSGWRFVCDKVNGTYIFPGFAAFRKKALLEVGGFNKDTLCEDFDIGVRLRKSGYKLVMSNSVIYTKVPETITGLCKQRIRWGRGTIQVLRKHYDVILNKTYGAMSLYGIPTQIYWFFHGFVYIPIIIYQILGGYLKYFAIYGNYFSFDVVRYFFSWFSIYGMIEYVYRTITGEYDINLLFYLLITMFALYLIYDLLLLIRMSNLSIRYLFVIFFYFPYSVFTLGMHTFAFLYELRNEKVENKWGKNK